MEWEQCTVWTTHDNNELNSNDFFSDIKPCAVSEAANDEKTAKWLWTVSEKWTNVSF